MRKRSRRDRIEELERRLEGPEREFNGLIEKGEDLKQKIEMGARFTLSVGIREISFVERECKYLVENLNRGLAQKELDRFARSVLETVMSLRWQPK
ncbi:hypothetical protein FCM35_KLT17743 [Carex littledalei]|uniref:Uncharacterized protein n=1 Tax=Carex littledalei TaxID=544730 RepID=A0A833RDH7_9POAL|nr:hypothetical protein FCM35_KLT17743 [Carex littledalei]